MRIESKLQNNAVLLHNRELDKHEQLNNGASQRTTLKVSVAADRFHVNNKKQKQSKALHILLKSILSIIS
jgi:hypothetical protein